MCKRLSSRALASDEAVNGMRAEGALLEALGGRGAPRLVARGEDLHGPFMVMEHIAFPTLKAHMLRVPEGLHGLWLERAARSIFVRMNEVHAARDAAGPLGVVHADLSPDNLAVAPEGGDARVLDFGLAHWRDARFRDPGPFRGTLAYAAPELARGESIDVRADLFALAASLLHAASGVAPRVAPNEASLLLLAAESPIETWADAAAGQLAAPVRDALVACVAFDRNRRPVSAADVLGSW